MADFNGIFVDHFQERRAVVQAKRGDTGFAWAAARADEPVAEYADWVDQDCKIHAHWAAACDEHQRRLREFIAVRRRMK